MEQDAARSRRTGKNVQGDHAPRAGRDDLPDRHRDDGRARPESPGATRSPGRTLIPGSAAKKGPKREGAAVRRSCYNSRPHTWNLATTYRQITVTKLTRERKQRRVAPFESAW